MRVKLVFQSQAYELALLPLATSATGTRSASCKIRTIFSSLNLLRFVTALQVWGAIVSKSPWLESPKAKDSRYFKRQQGSSDMQTGFG
jgi:hypothetical protein